VAMRYLIFSAFVLAFGCRTSSAETLVTALVDGGTLKSGTYGYAFSVGPNSLSVQQLGVYDSYGNGLVSQNKVGIWSSSGDLIVAAEIGAGNSAPRTGHSSGGGFFSNSYRWVTLASSTSLSANTTYYLGASANAGMFMEDISSASETSPLLSPDVTFLGAFLNVGTFAFSSSLTTGNLVGPNMIYSTVPEPSSFSLLAIGGVVLAFKKRRQA